MRATAVMCLVAPTNLVYNQRRTACILVPSLPGTRAQLEHKDAHVGVAGKGGIWQPARQARELCEVECVTLGVCSTAV